MSWALSCLKEMGIPDYLTCLLTNLYAGQEATVRTRHGTTEWFQIGKGVCQGCILSLCLFNLYAEYISWHAGQDEAQTWIKIAGRNINNIRYADDTTLTAESKEELKSLLMKLKEESEKKKAGLKLNIQKMKIMASGLITSWQIDGETAETVTDFISGGSKITGDGDCSHEIKRCLMQFQFSWTYWHLLSSMWSLLKNVLYVLEKNVFSAAFGWNVFYTYIYMYTAFGLVRHLRSCFLIDFLSGWSVHWCK